MKAPQQAAAAFGEAKELCSAIGPRTLAEAAERMREIMDSQKRLMKACGLPSALTPSEQGCQSAPKPSSILS
jgi:hypothetical protein